MLNTAESLQAVKGELASAKSNVTVEYVDAEQSLSTKFNDYYFDTVTGSQDGYFWKFVDESCPKSSGMGSDDCNVDSYATTCPDEASCDDGASAQCPYDLCRRAAVTRFLGIVEPIGEYGIFVCIFETVRPTLVCFRLRDGSHPPIPRVPRACFIHQQALMILTCCLICFNPRDAE
mmetsp:Transcript_9611/g.24504  ORF Transcript_9611/g.24504 Transcript_9611/m.24504 type:complete len:176 (-) Transcript_9611:222-749(-)